MSQELKLYYVVGLQTNAGKGVTDWASGRTPEEAQAAVAKSRKQFYMPLFSLDAAEISEMHEYVTTTSPFDPTIQDELDWIDTKYDAEGNQINGLIFDPSRSHEPGAPTEE